MTESKLWQQLSNSPPPQIIIVMLDVDGVSLSKPHTSEWWYVGQIRIIDTHTK